MNKGGKGGSGVEWHFLVHIMNVYACVCVCMSFSLYGFEIGKDRKKKKEYLPG